MSCDLQDDIETRTGSLTKPVGDHFNSTTKKHKLKAGAMRHFASPIKLDKGLKSIENRIMNKMKNKRENTNSQPKMPSIERHHSPSISYGATLESGRLNIGRINDYNVKNGGKNSRYSKSPGEDTFSPGERLRNTGKMDRSNRTHSIRQTVAGAFNQNDADSIIKKSLHISKPAKESQSEYDLYNSYGSSNGFAQEKGLSNKMKLRIKASFKYRDEVETADSDSLFSSKFSKFGLNKDSEAQNIIKPNKSVITDMIKRQQQENGKPNNFPKISKNVPGGSGGCALPSLK